MNYLGKRVTHAVMGNGTIVKQDGDYISIQFPGRDKLSLFSAPKCFEKNLTLLDKTTMDYVSKELANQKREEEAEKQRHAREIELSKIERKCSSSSTKIVRYKSVDSFVSEQEQALTSEVMYLKKQGGKKIRIIDGNLIEQRKGVFIYSFEADSELNYPDGTQITLWHGSNRVSATLLGCEELAVYIAAEEFIGQRIPSIEFSAEQWQLLNFLIQRLKSIQDMPSAIVRSLVIDGFNQIEPFRELLKGQDNARKMACSQPITFIWGPPGTGKTWTLAKIALDFMAKNKRVLMLSYSNVSVDGAALRVYDMDDAKVPGKIIRYGYPKSKSLIEHPYLSSYNYVVSRHADLFSKRSMLQNELKKYDIKSKEAYDIRTQLKTIRTQLSAEEGQSVKRAAFVATTVSKAIADSVLYNSKYDVVIFDEASMAYIPQVIFAASLAESHFICIGDFNQLPPIVQSDETSILNADIFRYCCITDAVENNCGHSWLCMLNIQRRMHSSIADFASKRMYRQLLLSHPDMRTSRTDIVSAAPFEGQPLALADLSGMMSVCIKTPDNSGINVLSALISISLACLAAKKFDVGIITPYQAQSRLLNSLSKDILAANPELHKITCATVHQFQGSEKDVIIYDAVDCYRKRFPGILLTSMHNNYANRLFNVALSRARGKFIAVANTDYLISKGLSEKMMFRRLVDELLTDSSARKYVEKLRITGHNESFRWYAYNEGDSQYISDLANARKNIRIDIPAGIAVGAEIISRLSDALNAAKSRGVKLCIRAQDKSVLPKELLKYAITNGFASNPVTIIDSIITWFGMPESKACFISEGKVIPTTYRPRIRFVGRKFAGSLFAFLSMDRVFDDGTSDSTFQQGEYANFSSYIADHIKCPECGKPLRLKKGKRLFIGCSGYPRCKYTDFISVDMIEEYLFYNNPFGKSCPHDGTSLRAENSKFGGVYVCCGGIQKHTFRIEEL